MRVSETSYTLVLVGEDGTQYDISDFAEDLGWEENDGELATRVSFTLVSDDGLLSAILKIGCLVFVAVDGVECTRAFINDVTEKVTGDKVQKTVVAYDELYALQKSEDHFFFAEGQGTKAVISQIFAEWGIPLGEYGGADIIHGKLVYRSGSVADTVLDILKDAVAKGGPKTILRAEQGKVNIIQCGLNTEICQFDDTDTVSAIQKYGIGNIVTRVKVIGKEEKDGIPPVEAVLNGLTQYGVRQKIYVREKDKNTAEAQTEAQKILNEKGKIERTQSIQSPDVPTLRKGDAVSVELGSLSGMFIAKGVRHDAAAGVMTVDLEEIPKETVQDGQTVEKKEYNVGDIVQFAGGMHYVSSYPGSQGYAASAGPARIYKTNPSSAHPWSLIHTDGSSNVYGWVDDGTFV